MEGGRKEGRGMKKSPSELVLEAFLRRNAENGNYHSPPRSPETLNEFIIPDTLGFGFGDRESILSGGQSWSQTLQTPKQSSVSATVEYAQSSVCVGTPTSVHNPKARDSGQEALGGTSGSEQSDDESLETEGGPCEQSKNVIDMKRMRRKVSNRESARRSRKRKQAHLAELELQVDQLRVENSSLFKQLTDANQEFTDAVTNNRILKSDVEVLRVKVKMAEDMVTRGTLGYGIDQLLQSHLSSPQFPISRQPCRVSSEVLPAIDFQGDDICYAGLSAAGQVQHTGMQNNGTRSGDMRSSLTQSSPVVSIESSQNMHSRITNEVGTCGASDIWAWDSDASAITK